MLYCVLIKTELADAKYDYFEKPVFCEDKEQALAYIDATIAELSSYPVNFTPVLLRVEHIYGGFYED